MMHKSSSRLHSTNLKLTLGNWRLCFLIFVAIYAIALSLDLANTAIQWDEVGHLTEGALLLKGNAFTPSSFYPPLFDFATMVSYGVLGVSVVSGRLVAVVFSLLSLWVVFEFAYRMYGGKAALIASVLLGIMPGYFWLSRLAMIETMLVFFFTLSMFFFFNWLRKGQDKMLVLSGLALGLGFLAKYQVIAAGLIMIGCMVFLARDHIKPRLTKFTLLIITFIVVIAPWIIVSYQAYASETLSQWAYALQTGNPEKAVYSERFPLPIFYFIEMTWPYSVAHPISLFLYIVSLAGLGLFAWRRKNEDKFVLIWFIVVFVFFTLIPNKHWRYVVPLFPALAVSGAGFILFSYGKIEKSLKAQLSVNRKRALKVAAGLLTTFLAVALFFSVSDAYYLVSVNQVPIDIEGATNYAANRLSLNESIMLLCPFNFFNRDMVRFYLLADCPNQNQVYQYPTMPVDTYTPNFNITEFIELCNQRDVKYVFTYEYGGIVPYFNTTLNLQKIYMQLYDSGNFTHITDDATFGTNPRRIFVLTFQG